MTVTADLESLRRRLGVIGTADDEILQEALDQAISWVKEGIYESSFDLAEVQGAILDLASRWYQRRRSPEGVAGFSDFGAVRILSVDPDVRAKLRHHWDMTREGIA